MSSKWQSKTEKHQREIYDQKNLALTNGEKKSQVGTPVVLKNRNAGKIPSINKPFLNAIWGSFKREYISEFDTSELKKKATYPIMIIDLDHTIAIPGDNEIFWQTEPQNIAACEAGIPFHEFNSVVWKYIYEYVYSTFFHAQDSEHSHHAFYFVTARTGNKVARENTLAWLHKHIPGTVALIRDSQLIMREIGDHRPDYVTKPELVAGILERHKDTYISHAFDDNPLVLEEYHKQFNSNCHQVEGTSVRLVHAKKVQDYEVRIPETASSQ